MINIWKRKKELESNSNPRYWKHKNQDHEIRVEKFHDDDTWDAYRNDTLVENYDTKEEAIQKSEQIKEEI